jgi:hypothetical protein
MRTAPLSTLIASLLLAPLAHAANLLENGSFENGLDGWVATGNAALRTANPLAFDGTNYVFGANTPEYSVSQVVDLLAAGVNAGDIDAGTLMLRFGGYQAGFSTQTDAGQITVRLLDALGTQLTATSTPSFFSNAIWVEQAGNTALLPGTRSVSFEFVGTRVSGFNNDAYLDAAFVDVAPVPLPAALPLLGGALCVLARRRRRSAPTA